MTEMEGRPGGGRVVPDSGMTPLGLLLVRPDDVEPGAVLAKLRKLVLHRGLGLPVSLRVRHGRQPLLVSLVLPLSLRRHQRDQALGGAAGRQR